MDRAGICSTSGSSAPATVDPSWARASPCSSDWRIPERACLSWASTPIPPAGWTRWPPRLSRTSSTRLHHQYLTVGIVPGGQDPVRIDNQTIGYLFERITPINGDAVYYYRTISNLPDDEIDITERFGALGRLRAHISFADASPRRVAHINRNGMLITDSREQRVNPLAPRGRSLWPDFACVIVPDSDRGDLWLRKMENPSHDALSPGHLQDQADRRRARNLLRRVRRELRAIIDEKAEVDRYGDTTNIDELSDLLPDQESVPGDRTLTTHVIETRSKPSDTLTIITEESEDKGGGDGENPRDREVETKSGR